MAVTKEDLLISIQADTKNATAAITEMQGSLEALAGTMKSTNATGKKTADSVSSFGASMVKVQATISTAVTAMHTLKSAFDATVGAFREKEDHVLKLKFALAGLGDTNLKETTKQFQEFADVLQETTGIDDDVSLGLITMAKNMGLTDAQAEKLVTTSADVAAAFGRDLTETFTGLAGSFKGAGDGIARFAPQLAGMSAEQLKAGKGVDELGKRFDGFAKLNLKTFSGAAAAMKSEVGDIMAEVGRMISDALNLDNGQELLTWLKNLKTHIEDVKPLIQTVFVTMKDAILLVANAVSITINSYRLLKAEIKQLYEKPIVPKESVEDSIARLKKNGLSDATIQKIIDNREKLAEAAKQAFPQIAEPVDDQADAKIAGLRKEIVDAGKDMEAIWKNKVPEAAKKGLGEVDTELEALAKRNKERGPIAKVATQDQLRALEELKQKLQQLRLVGAGIGAGEGDKSRLAFASEMDNIQKIQNEMKKAGMLKGAEALLDQARAQAAANLGRELNQQEKDRLKGIYQQNADIAAEVRRIGMTQQETIADELTVQLQKIDLLEEELRLKGDLTAADKNSLDVQRSLLKEGAKKKSAAAPTQEFEAPIKAGEQIAHNISGAFGGLLGMGGYVQAIIGAAQAVVDIIPQILDAITKLISSIAELPMRIMKSFQGLFASILQFFRDFIPGIVTMVEGIVEGLVSFLEKFPDVIAGLVQKLPDMLIKFFEKLPEVIDRLITALADKAPEISTAIIPALVQAMPKVAFAFIKAIYIELPKAFYKSIVTSLQKAGGLISDMFKGKFPKLEVDTASMGAAAAAFKSKLTGATGQLFNVSDLADPAKGISDAAAAQAKAIGDVIQKAIDGLLAAWRWIYDHILKPLIDTLTAIWRFAYDTVVASFITMWAGLKAMWEGVLAGLDLLWSTLKSIWTVVLGTLDASWKLLKGTFDFAVTALTAYAELLRGVFAAAVELLKGAWEGIKAIWTGMMGVLSASFDAVKAVWTGMMGLLTGAWDGVKKLWQVLMDLFQGKISLLDALKESFRIVFETFTKALTTIKDTLKSVFEAFNKAFDATTTALKKAFDESIAAIGKALDKLKESATAAAKTLTDGFEKLKTAATDAAKSLSDAGTKAWDNFKAALDKGKSAVTDIGGGIWTSFKAAFDKGKDAVSNLGDAIWSKLSAGLGTIGTTIKEQIDALNPANLAAKMFQFDGGGTGSVEKVLGIDIPFTSFAKGGVVPGRAMAPGDNAMNDRILALLSPGEAVITRSAMANPAVAAIVQAIMSGAMNVPAFRRGGVIGAITGGGGAPSVPGLPGGGGLLPPGIPKIPGVSDLDLSKLWDRAKAEAMQAVMRAFAANKFGSGGYVVGPKGKDSVPAMLAGGEFVMSAPAVRNLGADFLGSLNQGRGGQSAPQVFNIEIKIDGSKERIDESFIRQRIIPTLREELRRASLNGERVVYASGVR